MFPAALWSRRRSEVPATVGFLNRRCDILTSILFFILGTELLKRIGRSTTAYPHPYLLYPRSRPLCLCSRPICPCSCPFCLRYCPLPALCPLFPCSVLCSCTLSPVPCVLVLSARVLIFYCHASSKFRSSQSVSHTVHIISNLMNSKFDFLTCHLV
jgi:hypothetical protein